MTTVIFRKFSEGDIIAFLPEMPANYGFVLSYMHVGQHGEAGSDISTYTKPATPEEYKPLQKELERVYGPLTIRNRLSRDMLAKTWKGSRYD
jgi:hypothetical protein